MMKKWACDLTAVLLAVTVVSAFAETDKEIRILDNEWLTTPKTVKQVMRQNGITDNPVQEAKAYAWLQHTMKPGQIIYDNVPILTLVYQNDRYYYRIADLDVDNITLTFAAPIKENVSAYSEDDYLLYLGKYSFAVKSKEDALDKYGLLLEKMKYLYGEPDEISEDEGTMSGKDVFWHGANSTVVCLRCTYSSFYNSLTVEYAWEDVKYFAQYADAAGQEFISVGDTGGL